MKNNRTKILVAALVAGGFSTFSTQLVHAETVTDTTAAYSAAPRLDFRIIIPGFLRFRVGTNSAAIDQITFDLTATPLNVGNSISQTGTGGDAGGGTAANVVVQGNSGQITITETNNSGSNGLGTGVPADGFIPYTEITTSTSSANLPAPTLSNAGGNTSLPVLNAGRVTNRTEVWTYGYANTTVPSAGTYGTSAQGGRVTYTATMP